MKALHPFMLLALLLLPLQRLLSQTTWSGAGADNNWSTAGNWTGGSPAGNAVIFNNTDPTTSSAVNNIVDSSLTVDSLTYANTGTNWQSTLINNDTTLTLDAATAPANILWVGTSNASSTYASSTNVKIAGQGRLLINEAASNFLVSTYSTGTNAGTTANGQAMLDMSALSAFEAVVNDFTIGYGRGSNATLHLASANIVSANSISIGRAEWSGSSSRQNNTSSTLYLGQNNSLYTTALLIGSNLSGTTNKNANSGTLAFDEGLSGIPTVVIRGLGSTALAPVAVTEMIIANIGGDNSNGAGGSVTNSSSADFTGGSVDALVNTLTIATGAPAPGSSVTGSFKMDAGTFQAANVLLGYSTANNAVGAATLTATLEIGGGTFTTGSLTLGSHRVNSSLAISAGYLKVTGGNVNVTGNLALGTNSSATAVSTTDIDIAGGTLTVGGNLAESSSTASSILKLRGGTLDMDGGNITVDTFTVESGTLKNVAQFNSGGTLTKTTAGTLILDGANTQTGATVVNGGTFQLSGTHTGAGHYSINNTATLAGTGTLTGATDTHVTIASGGTLSPGNNGTGTLNLNLSGTGRVIFESGSFLSMDAGDKIAFSLAGDWLTVDSGALFDPTGGSWQAGVAYTLIQGLAIDPAIVWALSSAAISAGYTLDASFGTDGYQLVEGNLQVQFATVPEPATIALTCIAGLFLILRRKNHRTACA